MRNMNGKVSDDDINAVLHAKVYSDKGTLNAFLCGASKILFVIVVKKEKHINVNVSVMYHSSLHLRFYNDAEYDSFKKILASKYPKLEVVYNDSAQTLYGVNVDATYNYTHSMLLAIRICVHNIADDDKKWKKFCKSEYDDYMLLLSDYIINDVRFSESLNNRLEAASDSDKVLAVINNV